MAVCMSVCPFPRCFFTLFSISSEEKPNKNDDILFRMILIISVKGPLSSSAVKMFSIDSFASVPDQGNDLTKCVCKIILIHFLLFPGCLRAE